MGAGKQQILAPMETRTIGVEVGEGTGRARLQEDLVESHTTVGKAGIIHGAGGRGDTSKTSQRVETGGTTEVAKGEGVATGVVGAHEGGVIEEGKVACQKRQQ